MSSQLTFAAPSVIKFSSSVYEKTKTKTKTATERENQKEKTDYINEL